MISRRVILANRCHMGDFSAPAFGAASRPRSAHFPQGAWLQKSGGNRPLRKMTSAAYGVSRDSIAEALAEGSPVRHSSQRHEFLKVCPVKKA